MSLWSLLLRVLVLWALIAAVSVGAWIVAAEVTRRRSRRHPVPPLPQSSHVRIVSKDSGR